MSSRSQRRFSHRGCGSTSSRTGQFAAEQSRPHLWTVPVQVSGDGAVLCGAQEAPEPRSALANEQGRDRGDPARRQGQGREAKRCAVAPLTTAEVAAVDAWPAAAPISAMPAVQATAHADRHCSRRSSITSTRRSRTAPGRRRNSRRTCAVPRGTARPQGLHDEPDRPDGPARPGAEVGQDASMVSRACGACCWRARAPESRSFTANAVANLPGTAQKHHLALKVILNRVNEVASERLCFGCHAAG